MKGRQEFRYPRRRPIRFVLRQLIRLGFGLLSELRIIGQENLPATGPLIVVANHFNFADPAAVIRATPWPLDFFAGFQMPDAPFLVGWLPKVWGIYAVRRGAASLSAMRAAKAILSQSGVLGIFPEGGSWAQVLRPARPGTAYVAVHTGVPLLPIGLDGLVDLLPSLRRGRRARVTIRIGKPFGPFESQAKGLELRQELEVMGDEIMRHIAELIPPERRGVFSADPKIRAAAQEAAEYPYHDLD
ncbi:MAG: lysophospholipid acyltransferase family protein [Anaerolineae bacterium]|jgi:1-acyl-sn-glycerol-3-phosphate acyltransferase